MSTRLTARWVVSLLGFSLLLSSCTTPPVASDGSTADTIYTDGPIITMNDANPSAEALAVKGGKILAVGSKASVLKTRGQETRVVKLNGRTLLPGFIDGHSHFINSLTVASQANVYAPPFGPGNTAEGIVAALKKLQSEQRIRPGEFILAYGFDENALPPDHPLTAADLDPAFPDNPVLVGHVSLHGAVLNTFALKKFKITAETPTPPGGIILRKPGTQEPSGLLMETAFLPIFATLPKPTVEQSLVAIEKGQRIYAAAGITTAQEGASHLADIELLKRGAAAGKLFMDVVAFPFITDLDAVLGKYPVTSFGKYDHGLKLGGVKVTTDGSPQGRTAYFTTPYLKGGPGGEQDWKGEPTFPKPTLNTMIKRVYDLGLPLIVHANGDAAIDTVLEAHAAALGDKKAGDHRTGIIHCQFVRPDQLDTIAAWNLIPSFYTEHVYFFGSTHTANRGPDQAAFISPLKTAISKGIRIANHTDFNVAPIDQLFVLWTAVNRVTREGTVLGASERVTPMEGLKALTIHPAYWYREESSKGSLEVGKLADLVILDRNPLTVDPMTIKDIRVMETIKEGRTIYAAR